MELIKGADYVKIQQILSASKKSSSSSVWSKQDLKQLLSLTQSDWERECVKYAVYKASGMIPSGIRKNFGLERMMERAAEVEHCIEVTVK